MIEPIQTFSSSFSLESHQIYTAFQHKDLLVEKIVKVICYDPCEVTKIALPFHFP